MGLGEIAILGGLVLLIANRNARNVYWRFKSFNIYKIGLQESQIVIELEFNNASRIDYRLENAYFILDYKGVELGTLQYNKLVIIPKNQITIVRLQMRVITREFLQLVNDGLKDSNDPLLGKLVGNVTFSGLPLMTDSKEISLRPFLNRIVGVFEDLKRLGSLIKSTSQVFQTSNEDTFTEV